MAATRGRAEPPVDERLFGESFRFEFFQAVRLLHRLFPDRRPIGGMARPSDEVVRFHAHLSLEFPPSQIYDLQPPGDQQPAHMTVAFMGLTGPLGVLPMHYTELLLDQQRIKATALRDFLDLFNHRLISLFYRAWEKYHFPVVCERAGADAATTDHFTEHLFDLMGLGTRGLQRRLGIDDQALLFYVGLLAQRPRSACALQGFLMEYFGVPVRVVQFIGEWLPLMEEARTRLGAPDGNSELGGSAVVGTQVWVQQAKFCVNFGPLSFAQFCDFLPVGSAFRPVQLLTRFFAGEEFNFDFRLILKRDEVPAIQLGQLGAAAPRLGWTTWLKTREFSFDPEDTVLAGRTVLAEPLPASSPFDVDDDMEPVTSGGRQ